MIRPPKRLRAAANRRAFERRAVAELTKRHQWEKGCAYRDGHARGQEDERRRLARLVEPERGIVDMQQPPQSAVARVCPPLEDWQGPMRPSDEYLFMQTDLVETVPQMLVCPSGTKIRWWGWRVRE